MIAMALTQMQPLQWMISRSCCGTLDPSMGALSWTFRPIGTHRFDITFEKETSVTSSA
jgi:hypothetical protein